MKPERVVVRNTDKGLTVSLPDSVDRTSRYAREIVDLAVKAYWSSYKIGKYDTKILPFRR